MSRLKRLWMLIPMFLVGMQAPAAYAADAGVAAKRLVITDLTQKNGRAKIIYHVRRDAGIHLGAAGDPNDISATLEVFYTSGQQAGRAILDMPQGGWLRNDTRAKYRNRSAPEGGGVKTAVIKPGKLLKITAKSLGDSSTIDLFAGGTPDAGRGITAVLTIFNRIDGSLNRMCSRFSTAEGSRIRFKELAGGRGRKLVARDGVPVPCTLDYDQDRNWLCRPGNAHNECTDNSLDATIIKEDLSTELESHFGSDQGFDYDCFYVYPTVHLIGVGNFADPNDVSFENDALLAQAARLNKVCNVYAPLYRQTRFNLTNIPDPDRPFRREFGLRDARAAWLHYLENHNNGRNVVIMGHSQGTSMITSIIQELVDPDPDMLDQLIMVLAIGGGISVPEGGVIGGTFENIPLCTANGQTGCVIAYRSYAEGFPPEGGSNIVSGSNDTACTNPGALAGGAALYEGTYIALTNAQPLFNIGDQTDYGTPYNKWPNLYEGECAKDADNRSYLQIRVRPQAGDLRTNQIPFNHHRILSH